MKQCTLLLLLLSSVFISCKKNSQGTEQPDSPANHLKRPHGNPTGEATTIRIGSQGGELISNDGRMKIIIPTGAVTETVLFSVQEVENVLESEAKSYRLLPEEVNFQKPVTITYYYGGLELGTMHPDFLFLAFQDREGYFYSANKTRGDRQQQTLSVATSHFSDWTFFSEYELFFPDDHALVNGELHLLEKEQARIILTSRRLDKKKDTAELPEVSADPVIHAATWNYSPKTGTMIPIRDFLPGVTYKAPDKVSGTERTFINATINGNLGTDNRGNTVNQMQFIVPVVMNGDGYFILSEHGMEAAAIDFSAIYMPGMGCQFSASFLMGYTLNFNTYGAGLGNFAYGEHGQEGMASLGLSTINTEAFLSFRPKDCQQGGAFYSPGGVILKSVAHAAGEYFEGEFTAMVYSTDYCKKADSKTISGRFRIRRNS
ncbi:MAG: hypothetical protein QM781_04470 [Chitinophagaceae bacterium]